MNKSQKFYQKISRKFNTFNKMARYTITLQKSTVLPYIIYNRCAEIEVIETLPFTVASNVC